MDLCTKLSNRVTTLENELSSTKAVYHKAFITLTKRVKKLETQLKKKRSRAVIHSSNEEEPSVDIKDSPKQGRIIKELDKDENVNLVTKRGEVHETAEPSKDYNDATLAETLLNIKRTQNLYAEELVNKAARQEQEKYNLEKALELQRQLDKREKDVDKCDQAQEIDLNDPTVLRYHALNNKAFFKAEKQKLDEQIEDKVEAQVDSDQEVEEMKLYMRIVLDEEIAIDAITLSTKPSVIVEYKIFKEGKGMDTCGSHRHQETMGGTPAQTRFETVLEQPNEPPLLEGHTSGSGEGRMEHTVELADIVPPTPHD
nr:hypothetical protein [Tanacetum cinerariifolium]